MGSKHRYRGIQWRGPARARAQASLYWTASGACTSGSTAPPRGATRRASGGAATTSTARLERGPPGGEGRRLHQDHRQGEVLGAGADVRGDDVDGPGALLGLPHLDHLDVVRRIERQGASGRGWLIADVSLPGGIRHEQVQVVDQ